MEELKLEIEIKNQRAVELADFAKSMASLADEYSRYLSSGENSATPDDVKLFVRDMRSGSIIADLVALAPAAIPFLEHAQTLVGYAQHLKGLYDFYCGKTSASPLTPVDKSTLQNLSTIVEPIAKDAGSQMNIAAMNIQGGVVMNFGVTSLEANAAQNAIRRELEAAREPITGLHEQVVMYWAQARNATKGTGDKARVESIFKGDVKVRFATDALKAKMLHDVAYPFGCAFVVDVIVETVKGRPALYKVVAVHEELHP